VGWIDEALFNEELCLLGEDGAPFLERDKPKAYVIHGPSWVNNHAHVLRAASGLTFNRFLKYALDWTDYGPFVNGTTRLKLTKRALSTMTLPLPPPNEQRRIVSAIEEQFSRLDAAEELLGRARRRLDLFAASAVHRALQGTWSTVRLSEVTEGQVYGTSAKATTDPSGVPVLRMGNIRAGKLDLADLKYLPSDHPDVPKLALREGDLLFNRTNSPELVGKAAVFNQGPDPTVFASYLIRVRLRPGECDPGWASLVINGPIGRRYVASVRTQQVGQANVNGTKLAAMPIPLPPLDEQRRRVARVERQDSVIEAIRDTVEAGERRVLALRRAILDRAFSGKLVPQDPADEPAAALLERIAAAQPQTPTRSRRRKVKA
jgi:type I restriction enzyme S subunit